MGAPEWKPDFTEDERAEFAHKFWVWRDANPSTCVSCDRKNLEAFECAWVEGECLHCCGCWNVQEKHEQYTYEETEESEV